MGVRVDGVELTTAGEDDFEQILALRMEHEMVAFSDQQISVEDFKRFGSAFGELDAHPYINALPDHPEVLRIVKEADERANFGGGIRK